LFCEGDQANQPGTCQPLPGNGGDCGESNVCNDDDLFCNDVMCQPKRADGEGPCSSSRQCQTGLRCLTDATGNSMCVAPLADGLDCNDSDDCESLNCQNNTCDPQDLCF
jgi:hypothetical protein